MPPARVESFCQSEQRAGLFFINLMLRYQYNLYFNLKLSAIMAMNSECNYSAALQILI